MEEFNLLCEIPGKEMPFSDSISRFFLHSHYDDHHRFEMTAIVESACINDVKDLLGEIIFIKIEADTDTSLAGKKEGTFKGVIDQVKLHIHENSTAYVLISGYSPTVFLDAGAKMRAFESENLADIAQQLLQSSNCSYYIDSTAEGYSFDWKVQPGQCDWPFLKSLCDQTGELELYYDGEQLVLADLTNNDLTNEVVLHHGEGLSDLTVNFDTFPQEFTLRAFDDVNCRDMIVEHPPLRSNSRLINAPLEKSKIYGKTPLSLTHTARDEKEMKKLVRRMAASQANELMVINGRTNDPSIKIGTQLTVHTFTNFLDEELSNQQFTVIEVNHQYSEAEQYSNTFKAIATHLPYNIGMTYSTPEVGPLSAVVVDNEDPEYLGRVRVRLVGDENKSVSPWIRVLQPYTGTGGCFFVPKVGDYVVVLGENFHPDLGMIVLGSFYTGSLDAKKWSHRGTGLHSEKCGIFIDDESGVLVLYGDEIQIISRGLAAVDGTEIHFASNKCQFPKK